MGSEDPVFRPSADQPTSSQETPGGASRKRRAPSESCEPTGGSSPVNPGLNQSSPTRCVRCCHRTSPSYLVVDHETLNTQASNQPASPLPRGLPWITQNVQQRSPTRPRCQEAPSTALPAVSSVCQVMSPTYTAQHFLLKSPSPAPERHCHAQRTPSRSVHSRRTNPLTALAQPSMSQAVSLNLNEEPLSPDSFNFNEEPHSPYSSNLNEEPPLSNNSPNLNEEPHSQNSLNLNEEPRLPDFGLEETYYLRALSGQILFSPEEDYNFHMYFREDDFRPHEDQHAALRLDIEGMSYEELLELEDRMGKVNRGINSSDIHQFLKEVIYTKNKNDGDSCTICLEAYDNGDTLGQLSCGHAYHFSCIAKWIGENLSCPICKRSPERCGGAA